MSVADKLTQLATIKSNIKSAIIAKGVTVSDDMTAYATAIGNIPTGGGGAGISLYGYVNMGIYDPSELFSAIDLTQDGQFTMADYTEYIGGGWEGLAYVLQVEPIETDNIPSSDNPHYLQDLAVNGFAPWAIPLGDVLDEDYNRLWIVLDVGNIGGEGPRYPYYAVYKGPCAPISPYAPLAFGTANY